MGWDSPLEFDPRRWDEGPKKPCGFIPWASGPRQCIGREFAMLTGRIALFLIMNQYALELSPKAKVKPNEHLFVFPQGLLLKAQKRQSIKPAFSPESSDEHKSEK